ncbi:hypothetical protein LTR99_004752 [Exophiala xenobiotica]|nr:hypothetical protein LTR99_004752 [Exophiala xenobiotica]
MSTSTPTSTFTYLGLSSRPFFGIFPSWCVDAHDVLPDTGPQEVASLSSTVISMVPTSKHVKEVYLGPKGVLEALKGLSSSDVSETLCIDESTIEQSESRNISQEIKAVGVEMIDAPVSGVGARDGTLTMMVGGSREAFLRSVPVLQLMGKSVLHCGDLGAGLAAKLANNEVMLLGKRLGLQPQQLAEIINSSTGRCWASEVNNPVPEVSVNISPPPSHREYRGGFATKLAHKDLVLAVAAAREAGSPVPMGEFTEALYRPLAQPGSGYENSDFGSLYKWLEKSIG